jgi:hypothetical protein
MRSQFQDPLTFADGHLTAEGPFHTDLISGDRSFVSWVVTQGDLTGFGTAVSFDNWWGDQDEQDLEWQPGPAVAQGVAVTITPGGGFKTLSWTQDLTLEKYQ